MVYARLNAFQKLFDMDREARLRNRARLHRLINEDAAPVDIVSSHDARELRSRKAAWRPTEP